MTSAFLLRFQETCKNAPPRPDMHRNENAILNSGGTSRRRPVSKCTYILSSGTKTFTEIGQESGDNDPANRQFETFPRTLL